MELCTGGSLQTMLDDPQNLHGLEEYELKRVLKHISKLKPRIVDENVKTYDVK